MSKTKHYPDADQNPEFPAIEQQVLAQWAKDGTFAASIDQRDGEPEFIFYDGPPFANGLPHYGHLLTGYVKDVFARYQTMRGKKVERRFGWDCHGLPAEMGSEKELGISGRAAITNYGIGKFNEHCRTSVMKYTHEWEQYVTRQARWVDFKNDYKTMDTNFMESVLWAFKQLWDKGLVYEAYRVMPYSWAAETPLSNFETKLDNSYRERRDKAISVMFQLNTPPKDAPKSAKYFAVAWTTTPWTLPSNLALAVNTEMDYVAYQHRDNEWFIVAEAALTKFFPNAGAGENIDNIIRYKGADLVGLSYHPLFPYFASHKHSFKILDGSTFVTDGDGTGIVHMAPGFGEEDQKCCEKNGIELVVPVDGQGKYTDAIFDLPGLSLKGLNVIAQYEGLESGEPYKEEQIKKYGLVNLRIIQHLKNHPDGNKIITDNEIAHNYPHCWRTDQPLIYRAMPSWYVEVTKFRERAVELNRQINWIPAHIGPGQMEHMLATAPDWSISRNRFWGTPIPVWRGDKGGIKVFGSIAELKEFFCHPGEGRDPRPSTNALPDVDASLRWHDSGYDLHRPFIDQLVKTDEHGETWRRVEDVFDCWFESGSMPFAQVHYPFENKEWFHEHFPADFITEYVGQTRGWFNTLIMLSTALFDKPPFKNCICHGVVLDAETGLKYSKRLKNYKDPLEVINVYGADALRWLMIASPVMRGQDLMVDPEGKFIRDVVRLAIKPIWNAYNFFTLYANADGVVAELVIPSEAEGSPATDGDPSAAPATSAGSGRDDNQNIMDRYILAKCGDAVEKIRAAMDAYDTPTACEAVLQFFDVLNNWYIRRSKERFWKETVDADKQAAYDTLYTVLVTMCKAAAPLLPLTLEEIYRGLTGEKSVHLAEFPSLRGGEADAAIHLASVQQKESKQDGSPRFARDDDNELIADMDRVQDICNAALALRNAVNIRVRQPLKSIRIVTNSNIAREWKEKYGSEIAEIIKSEINVKEISEGDMYVIDYANEKLSINSAILGKRLPAMMKQILPASKKGEWKQVEGTVEICGEKLLPEEYTLQLEPKPEYKDRAQALSTNDALVILDTALTPELIAEGIARDVVRMVQQARKDAGLHVSDKIALAIAAPGKAAAAIDAWKTYIAEQTLASSLDQGALPNAAFTASGTVEGDEISISLARAA